VAFLGEVAGLGTDTEHASPVEPAGWMVCDGRVLEVSQYRELFAVLGYRYSKTRGGTTFNLPDLRGYFLRGVDPTGKVDPDTSERKMVDGSQKAEVGSMQQYALQLHEHELTQATAAAMPSDSGTEAGTVATMTGQTTKVIADTDTVQLQTSAAETRPVNVAVYYLIKFTRYAGRARFP
jgi:microcystin-dependent protein